MKSNKFISPRDMKHQVLLLEQPRYDTGEICERALEMMRSAGLEVSGKSVFLKPSFVYPARPPRNRGVNTQPEFVGGVARALKKLGARAVWVGEDCLVGPSQSAFEAMRVLPVLRRVARPVYLQDEERVEVRVADAFVESRFLLPRRFVEADLFITLPKLKVNMYTGVSLSVKNHMGLLLAADRLPHHHGDIHKKIADLYRARVPDFSLIDAIVAGEGQGPMHADPVSVGLMIGSRNGPAADIVGCELLGYRPEEIEHLRLLAGLGLGPARLDAVDESPRGLLDARRFQARRPRIDFDDVPQGVAILRGSEKCCPEGCLGMLRGSLDRWARGGRWGALRGFTFIVGKPAGVPRDAPDPRRTIVIGDCAEPHGHAGTHLPGCPVPPMQITYALLKKGIYRPLQTRVRDLAKGYAKAFFGK